MASQIPKQKQIIILGAGITSLSVSLSLCTTDADKPTTSYKQTIIASHLPGDFSIDYTSPWAGGHWRSFASTSPSDSESRIRKWDKRTYESWMAMLESGYLNEDEVREVGLGIRESRNYWGSETAETEGGDGRGLWWSAKRYRDTADGSGKLRWMKGGVEGFEVLDLEAEKAKSAAEEKDDRERVPDGAVFGVKYKTICINIPQYLSFMFWRVKEQGTAIIKATVNTADGLEGVVKDAKRILMENDSSVKEEDIFAIINCTGLGARHFIGSEEAAKLYPVRGQTILVKGEASKARTYVGIGADDELVYVIPRPGSGTTILGGCKQVGNWSEQVDEELNQRVLERVKKWGLAEELRTGRGREFEVVSYQVGLRPGRKGGPRVEVERGGKVDGVWVVHSYGHAGGGYQCSSGCAEELAEILAGL